eukprot:GGOE01044581.1.p1 GENE.GGOE01044581.1~~GGOE01044581.1.p1  ORF type:complete len:834 (+),score=202.73 GGOE01044581.1:363-2504(+)
MAQFSFTRAQLATDSALQEVTEALHTLQFLSPAASAPEEEANRLSACMGQAEAAMRAELTLHSTWDPAAHFPSELIQRGTRSVLEQWQRELEFLSDAQKQLSEWEREGCALQKAMNGLQANQITLQQLKVAKDRVSEAYEDLQEAEVQHGRASRMGNTAFADHVDAARRVLREAKVGLQAAIATLIVATTEFPELSAYVELGLPEQLLPLWRKERQLGDFEDLQLIPGLSRNRLYRGSLGGKQFAIKGFPILSISAGTCLKEAVRLVRAAHPHVVEVVALFQDPSHHTFYVQMPFYSEGSLDQWAVARQPDVPSMRRALLQAFEGVAHLHRLGIIHSDLKPSNLLVAANGTVRVGDLDVSVDLATRVSPQHAPTSLGVVGFTAGYAAPELLRTGATEASDVYSLGAVVREMGQLVETCKGEDAEALIQRLCVDEPNNRPAVAQAMLDVFFLPALEWRRSERRMCAIMATAMCEYGDQPVPLERGLECTGAAGEVHFVCDGCLAEYIQAFLQKELRLLRATEGRIGCPQCMEKGTPYTDQQLAQHVTNDVFGSFLRLRRQLLEQQLAEAFDQQLHTAVEAERAHLLRLDEQQRRVRQARQHIAENVLNLRCPRCHQVFVDFNGCCALSCSRCPCGFCAWCGQDCGTDAHEHVPQCVEKPDGVNCMFPDVGVWDEHQRQRRQRQVQAYLDTLEVETKQAVVQELRQDLANLQLVV